MINKIPMKVGIALGMLLVFVVGLTMMFVALDYTVRSYIVSQSKDFLAKFIQIQVREHLHESDFLFGDSGEAKANFMKYLKEVSLPETLQVSFWDRNSRIIFSSNFDLIGRQFINNSEFQEAVKGRVGARLGFANKEENPIIPSNGEILEIYVPVDFSDSGNPVGIVELYYNFSKVSTLINQMKIAIFTIAFVLIFAVLGLFWWIFNSWIARPILTINKALKSFRIGRRFAKAEISNIPELGSLAKSFNEMVASLQEAYENLEIKVEERTKSLNLAMEDLEKSKVRTEALLSSIGDGVVATDIAGRVIFINEAASKMIGWPVSEVMGKIWTDDLPLAVDENNKLIPIGERPIKIALISGKTLTANFYYKRKDGSKFPIIITASPVILGNKTIGAEIVFRDITKEREVERAKTEFVSLASHQLRTPLSAMKWTIEMMLEKKRISKAEKEKIVALASSTERLIAIVNDLLNIARMESGKALGVKEKVDILRLTGNIVEAFIVTTNKKKQTLKLKTDLKEAPAVIVPTMFTQAVQNLIANAVNYAPEKAEISISLDIKGGDYIIAVHNTGSFIVEEDRKRIFEKFYRGVGSQQARSEGSGLGLYISKFSVEINRGKIWFESNRESGTTFFFTVPIDK